MECSLFLNSTLVSFAHWHYTHNVWGICNFRHIPYNSFLLIFTILSKCVCPNILCQSQLWFSFLEQHLSLLISFRMYMSFGVLIFVATNFLKSFFPYFTYFELNISVCPWSHIFLTLIKICFVYSTGNFFYATAWSLLPRLIVPFPIIWQGYHCQKWQIFLFLSSMLT